jgi:hypothetical protein
VVVAGSFLPAAGSLVTMLRHLRLLRVLKLVKSLPALAVIVNALIMGLSSIGFIGIILGLCFYLFAILGMILFRDNDPWHFGSLHTSILTLFRCATGEDWTDVMYINIYGCGRVPWTDQYQGAWNESKTVGMTWEGGDDDFSTILYDTDDSRDVSLTWVDGDSDSPDYGEEKPCQYAQYPGKSFVAALFFIIFMLLGSLVLLTLFIGVICTSMDEAQAAQKEEKELEERIIELAAKNDLSEFTIASYKKTFDMLDVDNGGEWGRGGKGGGGCALSNHSLTPVLRRDGRGGRAPGRAQGCGTGPQRRGNGGHDEGRRRGRKRGGRPLRVHRVHAQHEGPER